MHNDSAKQNKLAVIILAAGKGTRMNNPNMAKVMFPVDGKPMIEHVIELAESLHASRIITIVGWQKDSVIEHVSPLHPNVEFVEQAPQLGTGHAVLQAENALADYEGDVLILSGDVPLLAHKTVTALAGYHRMSEAAATILTAELLDPTGYGRIIRNDDGSVRKIVEHKDALKAEREVREINSGIYIFEKSKLFASVQMLQPNNAQGEYYLTDVFEHYQRNHWKVSAVKAIEQVEVMGINTVEHLEMAHSVLALAKMGANV